METQLFLISIAPWLLNRHGVLMVTPCAMNCYLQDYKKLRNSSCRRSLNRRDAKSLPRAEPRGWRSLLTTAWRVTARDKIRLFMADPLLLYSTNTWLAYVIAERYYGGEHYVWCAPVFDPRKQSSVDMVLPPTSSPCEIYRGLYEETKRGDRHSGKITENRGGILRGAAIKKNCRTITADEEREITEIIESAEIYDFRPLLYVIPFHQVVNSPDGSCGPARASNVQ